MKNALWRWLTLMLISLGLLISGYLLSRHFALVGSAEEERAGLCSTLFGSGCDAALLSQVSTQFGLPLAGWGVIYYITLFALLLVASVLGDGSRFEALASAFLISVLAGIVSITLVITMAVGVFPFCPLCIIANTINLCLVLLLKTIMQTPVGGLWRSLIAGVGNLVNPRESNITLSSRGLLGYFGVLIIAIETYQTIQIATVNVHASTPTAPKHIEIAPDLAMRPVYEIPVGPEDATLGPADAPIQLVVFSDFQCPHCAVFARESKKWVDRFRNRLRIVFKHFPLSAECNSEMNWDPHPSACQAALAAQAAHNQDKFWEFHDALFSADLENGIDEVIADLVKMGLDAEQLEEDRKGNAVLRKVKADINLANELLVDGTPALFINGRRVDDVRPPVVEKLIEQNLQLYRRQE